VIIGTCRPVENRNLWTRPKVYRQSGEVWKQNWKGRLIRTKSVFHGWGSTVRAGNRSAGFRELSELESWKRGECRLRRDQFQWVENTEVRGFHILGSIAPSVWDRRSPHQLDTKEEGCSPLNRVTGSKSWHATQLAGRGAVWRHPLVTSRPVEWALTSSGLVFAA